jgi:hypothetical protein
MVDQGHDKLDIVVNEVDNVDVWKKVPSIGANLDQSKYR